MAGYVNGENIKIATFIVCPKKSEFYTLDWFSGRVRSKVAKRWTGNISMVNQRQRREIVSKMIKQVVCVLCGRPSGGGGGATRFRSTRWRHSWFEKILEKNRGYDSYKKLSKKANISHQTCFIILFEPVPTWDAITLFFSFFKKFMTAFSLL